MSSVQNALTEQEDSLNVRTKSADGRSWLISKTIIAEGISIPASYTAHLAPVSSSKLHCEVQDYATKKNKNQEIATETPYVVMFQQVNILSGAQTGPGRCGPRIQECWSFEHPRRDMILDSRGRSYFDSR